MGGFNTRFHATLDELGDIIETWLDQHPIVISAFAFPPCTRVAISRDTLREVLARPDIGEVTFTLAPVDPGSRPRSPILSTTAAIAVTMRQKSPNHVVKSNEIHA